MPTHTISKTLALASALGVMSAMCACSGLEEEATELDEAARARRIEHVVVVMMENRSFDHMLGWVPGADGRQAGLVFADESGATTATHALAPDFQGCGHPDPDHSFQGGRIEYSGGACDGWLRAGDNDEYAVGYYREAELPFYSRAVRRFVTLDRYFSATMASTFANRIYQHAAQTDRLANTLALSTLPTIWDRLADAGVEGRYYYSDLPFLALWGVKYRPISRPIEAFVEDAVSGDLPAVAFVDPRFLGEEEGVSGDDHPHADIRNGQAFLDTIYRAVTHSPDWQSTVLVINYDEWGGFYDHVPPPERPIPPADLAAGATDGLLGFRTPAVVISPWAPEGTVSHAELDHTSVLKMIETRWNLAPLTVRDAGARDLADVLDFGRRSTAPAPAFQVPDGPFGAACDVSLPGDEIELADLAGAAALLGWPIFEGTQADLAALLADLLDSRP